MSEPRKIVVVGAGIGGLTTAAILSRAGLDVTVLEAHVYPGGCAGTFYHKGYRFDAGATLAGGFYPGGPMDMVGQAAGISDWAAHPAEPAMVVHLPGKDSVSESQTITRWAGERRWAERRAAFGPSANSFWRWQEQTADALWALALQNPMWPPQTLQEGLQLMRSGLRWLGADLAGRLNPRLMADLLRPVGAHLRGVSDALRLFVDAQLLIAAQTTSRYANALYGASALDLPRRGVVHFERGMGAIAEKLVAAVRDNGGTVHFRQEVQRIVTERSRPVAVEAKRGHTFPADLVILNLPPWNIARLLPEASRPRSLRNLPPKPQKGWGAFMVYVGLDQAAVPQDLSLHHQIIVREPLAEGNSVFMSLSPAWDQGRGPNGNRAITLSTHTNLEKWWHLYEQDKPAYEALKARYMARMLTAAETILPEIRLQADLILPGTPITFQRFTRRAWGWVGGFPQINLFQAWGPRLGNDLWMVGDSIFPGQSTAAVAMGGMRVAQLILQEQTHPQPKRSSVSIVTQGATPHTPSKL